MGSHLVVGNRCVKETKEGTYNTKGHDVVEIKDHYGINGMKPSPV